MHAGLVACCPLVSHVKYAPMGQTDIRTDGRTPDRYITLYATRCQCNDTDERLATSLRHLSYVSELLRQPLSSSVGYKIRSTFRWQIGRPACWSACVESPTVNVLGHSKRPARGLLGMRPSMRTVSIIRRNRRGNTSSLSTSLNADDRSAREMRLARRRPRELTCVAHRSGNESHAASFVKTAEQRQNARETIYYTIRCVIIKSQPMLRRSLQSRDSHLCRVAGNTVWSHVACEIPVAVKSYVDAKLLCTVYFTYFTFLLLARLHIV